MLDNSDFLSENYNIDTPENVTFGYEVAGIGSRFIGALIDSIILGFALLALNLLLLLVLGLTGDLTSVMFGDLFSDEVSWVGGLVLAVYALVNFGVFWGYYVLFELLWNGQTPGKRVAGLRVLRTDGNPAGPVEVVVRNLVRFVDFLPSGYALGLVTMFFNRQARRLGDFAAGTLVIKEQRITLDSLSLSDWAEDPDIDAAGQADGLLQEYPTLHRLSPADYRLIREALDRGRRQMVDETVLCRLATVIAAKLECPEPSDAEARQFLRNIAIAYRRLK